MKMLTVKEVAKLLGISKDTVYRKARSGEIPVVRIGKSLRFPQNIIEDWIQELAAKVSPVPHRTARGQVSKAEVEYLLKCAGVCEGPEDLADRHNEYLYGKSS